MHPKQLLLFTTSSEKVSVSVTFKEGTFWLSQKAIAELFVVKVPAISKHLKNIFEAGELDESSTVSKMEIVHQEGKRVVSRVVDFYHLEAILAVGYRVNPAQATDFRKWATQTLNEFIVKGFVIDDERLKQGKHFGHEKIPSFNCCFIDYLQLVLFFEAGAFQCRN